MNKVGTQMTRMHTDAKDFQSVSICVHLCPICLSVLGTALLRSYEKGE